MGQEILIENESSVDYQSVLQNGLDTFELRAQNVANRYIVILCRSNAYTDLYYWRSNENGDVSLKITVYEEFPVRRSEIVRGFLTNGGKHYCQVMGILKRYNKNTYYHVYHNETIHVNSN